MLDLDPIKARRAAIGEGSWRETITEDGGLVVYLAEPKSSAMDDAYIYPASFLFFGDMEDTEALDHAQAEFVAHAPQDVDALIAEVEKLREARDLARKDWRDLYRNTVEAIAPLMRAAGHPMTATYRPPDAMCDLIVERDAARIEVKRLRSALNSLELREALSDYAHEAWSGWMRYLFDKGALNLDGSFTIWPASVARWKRQCATPYGKLPDQERESDRAEADKMLALVRGSEAHNGQ